MDIKKIFFLVGLPRAGNTLLGSILNQNPDIAVTANSITPDILYVLYRVKNLGALGDGGAILTKDKVLAKKIPILKKLWIKEKIFK